MAFDRAAHRKQAARVVSHYAGGEVMLRLNGKGDEFPAVIARDNPKGSQVNPDVGSQNLELVTIARDARNVSGELVFTDKLPREGQHFTDQANRVYRIQEDRSVSHAATLVYACGTAANLS